MMEKKRDNLDKRTPPRQPEQWDAIDEEPIKHAGRPPPPDWPGTMGDPTREARGVVNGFVITIALIVIAVSAYVWWPW